MRRFVQVTLGLGSLLVLLRGCGSSGSQGDPFTPAASTTGATTATSSTASSSATGGNTTTASAGPTGGVIIGSSTIGGSTTAGGGDAAGGPCVGLQCQQTSCTMGNCQYMPCAAGMSTTVRGTVYDPAGKVPIYNVVVYVPNADVPPLAPGASCNRCDSQVLNPATATLTDTHGNFVLTDVPVGTNIPLVMQVGKWRRQIAIPSVTACSDSTLTDVNQTRLPRNKAEGDIPLIAITTGGADSMECLPRRMGIDDAEFTTEAGNGRIHLYSGLDNNTDHATKAFNATLGGAALTPAATVWGSVDTLKAYDIVILSCEGALLQNEKPAAARQAMYDYESLGGRVFASHWHRYWFSDGPVPVPMVGTWSDQHDPPSPITGTIDTSFPKGQALADWLVNVGASTTPGQLSIIAARDNIQAVDATMATQWITIQAPVYQRVAAHTAIEYMSYNAPLNVPDAQQCGRAVFNDLHVSSSGNDKPGTAFPDGCEVRDLSAQEKAVEFMLFDLSSCVQNDKVPPKPPTRVN